MSRRMVRHAFAAMALCVSSLSLSPSGASAQTTSGGVASAAPEPGVDLAFDERAKAISSRLRCPVCQGESIQDSPAELATQMKSLVREQLANGKSETQVFDYFVGKYGQWIQLEPRAEGINLLVYGLPILFLVGGSILVWVAVTRWTQPVAPSGDDASPRSED